MCRAVAVSGRGPMVIRGNGELGVVVRDVECMCVRDQTPDSRSKVLTGREGRREGGREGGRKRGREGGRE